MIELIISNTERDIATITYSLLLDCAAGGTAALSFGSTYSGIFRKWDNMPPVDYKALPALFPADERRVPLSDPRSNWGSLWQNFSPGFGTAEDRSRWPSDKKSYIALLEKQFGKLDCETLPVFDVILLGMGPDGHTASLFPANCPREQTPQWREAVLETKAPFDPPDRLSLGPGLIASANRLALTVTGDGKADIFKTFCNQLYSSLKYNRGSNSLLPPARIIYNRERCGRHSIIIADNAAASKLPEELKKEWHNRT